MLRANERLGEPLCREPTYSKIKLPLEHCNQQNTELLPKKVFETGTHSFGLIVAVSAAAALMIDSASSSRFFKTSGAQ